MGRAEIEAFLTYLAVNRKVSASTQNQAFSALLLLYRDVLNKDLDFPIDSVRAKRPKRLPTVLTKEEVGKDVKTTMIHTHILNRGGLAVRSPIDML